MSRKSNISLSNRTLFYPRRKEILQLHEESQNSNVIKRDLSKQETPNSTFPNLSELCYGNSSFARVRPRRGLNLSCPKIRVHSHAVGYGEQSNKFNIPSGTPPIFKAKVWTTQAKSNQYNLSYFRRVFSTCCSPTASKRREQHFALRSTRSRFCDTTSLLCEAKSGCSRRPGVARLAQRAPEQHFRLDPKGSTESVVLGSSEARLGPESLEHLWLLRNPRDISVQWLERLGFTFSPFAFIFGTTFFFAALANTLQKQDGKQWLETLSHTKLPGLTANKVSQMSSWVFLESVLSQYINRDNSLLVSTKPLWGQPELAGTTFRLPERSSGFSGNSLSLDSPDSAKLRKALLRTPTFVQGKPTIGAVQLGGALEIQLSPIWSQHIKKDFLGVFPLRRTNGEPACTNRRFVNGPVESQKTLIWPWYQIMAYHSPNSLILSTWTDNTITKAKVSLRNNTSIPTTGTGLYKPTVCKRRGTLRLPERTNRRFVPEPAAVTKPKVLFEEGANRAPIGWLQGPHSNFDTSVERLRLEDDSIPSKKDSIYSKKKLHQDTLSARVLNVVKKSFYDYGLSIPGSAQPQNVLPSGRAEFLLQAPTGPGRTKPEVLLAKQGSASALSLAENGFATQSFRPEEDLEKFVESKNENLSIVGKDSVNRQFLVASLFPRRGAPVLSFAEQELTSANRTNGAGVAPEGLESKREQTVGLLRNEVSVLGESLNNSEVLSKPAQLNCQSVLGPEAQNNTLVRLQRTQGKPNLDGVINVTDHREPLRETKKLSKTGRRRDRISGSKPLWDQGLRSKASEKSSKPSLLGSTKSGSNKPSICSALLFRNIAIPKKSFWEYAHSISGYNFPELQDYEVAYLFRPKLRFGCPPKGGLKVAASTQSKVGVVTLLNEASRRHEKSGKADKLALTRPANSWFGIDTNRVFLTPYLAKVPPKVLLTASNQTEGLTPYKTAPCSHFCVAKLTGTKFRLPPERGASSEHQADLGFALGLLSGRAITNRRFVRAGDQLISPTIDGRSGSQPFAATARRFEPTDGAISTEQAKLGVPKTFVEVGSRTKAEPAAGAVLLAVGEQEVGKADRRHEQPIADNFIIRYTPLELGQENKVKKAFKELGRDYSDYLKQPKDSLPALLLSPSLEEDKQIEEEEVQRLAQEKAAAKAAAKRTQNEEEYSLSDSATNQEEFNILDLDPSGQTELRSAIEVALREGKNSANNLEEEPINEEENEDSRFERLRFTREVETKKEEEDCRGLALSLIYRDSNVPMAGLVGANKTFGFVRQPCLDKINDKPTGRLFRELSPPSGPLLTLAPYGGKPTSGRPFGGNRNSVPVNFAKQKCGQPERSSGQICEAKVRATGTKFRSILRSKSSRTAPFTNRRFVQAGSSCLKMPRIDTIESPRVSERKHSFFGQRSFWPTRLFSQEERLVSAHIVNPFILYDQSNPWLIPEQGGELPVTFETKPTANWPTSRSTLVSTSPATRDEGQLLPLRSKVCKTDDLQNLKNLQTQARLGLVRFVHVPLGPFGTKRCSEGTPLVEAALVTGQNRTLLSESNPQSRATGAGDRLGGSDGRAQLSLQAPTGPGRTKATLLLAERGRPEVDLPPTGARSASAQPKVGRSAEHGVNLSSAKVLIPPKFRTTIVDFAAPGFASQSLAVSQHRQSVTQKAGNQNRIYKPDPRLRLTPLESSISADWRNDRKVEASPFRVTSKERPHIVLPQLSENEWQKSLEWQLKRHFFDEDTRLEPLVSTEPYKTFKVKRIDRSLPWLTLEKPTFKLFQWPYKPVGVFEREQTEGLYVQATGTPFRSILRSKSARTAPFTNRRFVQAGSCKSPICSCPIPLASSVTTYSKDRSALSIGSNPLFDVTKKLFSSQDNVNTELLFERPSTFSWFLIYRLFLALILKEVLKYIYRISLKDFFIRIINSDFGRTITSPEFRQSVQFEPFSEFYKPKNRLKDLIGIKNALLPLSEIIWFLRNNCRSRNGPHGVILLGPEGVDGTAIAQAVAGEAKVPIIVQSLRALTLTHSHPQKRLEKVLLLARAQSPCVLFLDELDVIGQAREGVIRNTSGDGNSLISLNSSQFTNGQPQLQPPDDKVTSQGRRVDLMLRLLTVMDGLHHLNGVVIITTSKNTATLDPALLRPGRFDRLVHLTLPNHEHRMELFKVKTRELGQTDQMSLAERNSLLSVAELEYLSRRTANMGGADIVSAINYSTLRAIVNDTVHTIETLEYGLNCVKALKDKQSVALARGPQR